MEDQHKQGNNKNKVNKCDLSNKPTSIVSTLATNLLQHYLLVYATVCIISFSSYYGEHNQKWGRAAEEGKLDQPGTAAAPFYPVQVDRVCSQPEGYNQW